MKAVVRGREPDQAEHTFDFVCVDQESFEKHKPKNFADLVDAFRQFK